MHDDKGTLNDIIKETVITGDQSQNPWVTVLSALILGGEQTVKTPNPPLTLASWSKNTLLVQALLKLGANINSRDHESRTSLFHAVLNNDTTTAEVLLKAGAQTDLTARGGVTPLHVAAQRSSDMTRLLLDYNADPNTKDSNGHTPLDCARAAANHSAAIILDRPIRRTR